MLSKKRRLISLANFRLTKYTLVLVLLFVLPGCGLWSDFTTYFNLYYNTKDIYSQAETAVLDLRRDPFSLTDVPVTATAAALFTKVIEKASKILQYGSKSSFVDNAVMMLGKSFYYQKSYIKALRKFQELITAHPDSKYFLEAELWQAKTEMALKDFTKGLPLLLAVKEEAEKAERNEILSEVFIEEARYFIGKGEYEKAIEICSQLIKVTDDNVLKARTLFTIGDMYQKLGKYEEAITHYDMVNDYSPTYDIAFEARFRYGKILLTLHRYEEALKVFQQLRSEDKYKEFYDIVDLSIGISLRRLGRPVEAYRQFKMCDTTYGNSVQSGGFRYEIAQLYEHDYHNFDSAAFYYQKALSSTASAEYLPLIRSKSAIFAKYSTLIASFNENQRQYFYAVYPEEFSKDSLAFADTTIAKKEASTEQDKPDTIGSAGLIRAERERNFEALFEKENSGADALQKNDKKGSPKRPLVSADSLRSLLAKNTYELGNLFLTDLNLPDSAYSYYNLGLSSFSETPYNCRLLLAMANYYSIVNDTLKSDSLYTFTYEHYKEDRLVNVAAAELHKPLIDFDADSAKGKYSNAEKLLSGNNYSTAVANFYSIYKNYPKSAFAAKSLLATGYILEEKLKLSDSAAVVYDTLVSKYPNTDYAKAILPKLSFYKETRKAIADSIAAKNDSGKTAAVNDTAKVKKNSGELKKPLISNVAVADSVQKPDSAAIRKAVILHDEDADLIVVKNKGNGKAQAIGKVDIAAKKDSIAATISGDGSTKPANDMHDSTKAATDIKSDESSQMKERQSPTVSTGKKENGKEKNVDVKEKPAIPLVKQQKTNRMVYDYFMWKSRVSETEEYLSIPPFVF